MCIIFIFKKNKFQTYINHRRPKYYLIFLLFHYIPLDSRIPVNIILHVVGHFYTTHSHVTLINAFLQNSNLTP